MFHSTWDLEVYARDLQDRRQREAANARRTNGLKRNGRFEGDRLALAIARFVGKLGQAFTAIASTRGETSRGVPVDTTPPGQALAELGEQGLARHQPNHQSEPYSAMVVIARGKTSNRMEEPRTIGDR